MAADRRVYTNYNKVAAYIAESEKLSRCDKPTAGGYGNDPVLIDLTAKPDSGWIPVPLLGDYPDLTDAKIFTILALAVPAGFLALGAALGWVARGFKSN